MNKSSNSRGAAPGESRHSQHVVDAPAAHEGVRRALLGSFGAVPPMPDEMKRLLDRLN
jgi:hypothetical protein